MDPAARASIRAYWEAAACGEELYLRGDDRAAYTNQAKERYRLEPCIFPFADFANDRGKSVLELGVGLGADHEEFARAGADLWGIDLSKRAVEHTQARFATAGLIARVAVGDAEQLPFPEESFDIVYSWGVLHHTPDTPRAIREVLRVLKRNGQARIMIYHKHSLVGYMLWLRYGFLTLRWATKLSDIYASHLESPGTKAFARSHARELFAGFANVRIKVFLSHADLLSSQAGQRHAGPILTVARRLWPRRLLRIVARQCGLFMLVVAHKSAVALPADHSIASSRSGAVLRSTP